MLSWFVDDEVATLALKDPRSLIEEQQVEVLPEKLPDAVLDENVDEHLIRRCFTNDAWLLVKDAITRKRSHPVYDLQDLPSIVCEHCLSWYHLKCTGLRKEPKVKHWFCRGCHHRFSQ